MKKNIIKIIEDNRRIENVELLKTKLDKKSKKVSVDFKSKLLGVNYWSSCVVDLNNNSVEFL